MSAAVSAFASTVSMGDPKVTAQLLSGFHAIENRHYVTDVHATVLHQMGLDPNKLTYFFSGLDQKLVGVEGAEPIKQIV